MEFFRYGDAGSERPAVRVDGEVFDLRSLTDDIDGAFLARDGLELAARAVRFGDLSAIEVSDQRIGAPIARPRAVMCIGQNFAAHAAESGSDVPPHPVMFYKHPDCVVGPDDDVRIPRGATKVDWEVELAVIIKETPPFLEDAREAFRYVAGYAVSHDVSERAFQLETSGGQWSKGKSAATFNPLGPFLRPASEVDPQDLRLQSWVNGEPRQDSTTADMIFTVAQIVADLSRHVHLAPGDVINTGTPQGVALSGRFPYLRSGDVVELAIEGLGTQRQVIV